MLNKELFNLATEYASNKNETVFGENFEINGRNSKTVIFPHDTRMYLAKFFGPNNENIKREIAFYKYLKKCEIENVPEMVAFDTNLNLIILSFLEGAKITKISECDVSQCVEFISKINNQSKKDKAILDKAGGAITEYSDHFFSVRERIEYLLSSKINSEIENKMHLFVKSNLMPKWEELYQQIDISYVSDLVLAMPTIVSPSDFGFHNVLKYKGDLYFFDFEYAGLDDRFKLFCDYISQPDYLIEKDKTQFFLNKLLEKNFISAEQIPLIEMLLPFYILKWCCIVINEFRQDKKNIRVHAEVLNEDVLQFQLNKSKRFYNNYFEEDKNGNRLSF